MPVFFLDSVVDEETVTDACGCDYADFDTAYQQALLGLADIGKEVISNGAGSSVSIIIRDAERTKLAAVSVQVAPTRVSYFV